ncbi:MAG: helix-turn-helix domain-containing protein [Eubacteriales bacterium]|nr:helix-turn-helix domain-containing protein [Eubacteriales bacterium]
MRNTQEFIITNNPEEIDKFAEAFIDVLLKRLSKNVLKEEVSPIIKNIELAKEPILLSAKAVSEMINLGLNKTYELFRSENFPALQIGKQYFVEKETFADWLKEASKNRIRVL